MLNKYYCIFRLGLEEQAIRFPGDMLRAVQNSSLQISLVSICYGLKGVPCLPVLGTLDPMQWCWEVEPGRGGEDAGGPALQGCSRS